jgi:uncharacterized protein YuzE
MKRCTYDKEADAIYVYLNDKPYAYGKDLDNSRRIDYAADDTPIGIELLSVSKGVDLDDFPEPDEVVKCLKKHHIKIYA